MQELKALLSEPLGYATVETIDDNVLNWKVTLQGPVSLLTNTELTSQDGSPYEKGSFVALFTMSLEYPFKKPSVRNCKV